MGAGGGFRAALLGSPDPPHVFTFKMHELGTLTGCSPLTGRQLCRIKTILPDCRLHQSNQREWWWGGGIGKKTPNKVYTEKKMSFCILWFVFIFTAQLAFQKNMWSEAYYRFFLHAASKSASMKLMFKIHALSSTPVFVCIPTKSQPRCAVAAYYFHCFLFELITAKCESTDGKRHPRHWKPIISHLRSLRRLLLIWVLHAWSVHGGPWLDGAERRGKALICVKRVFLNAGRHLWNCDISSRLCLCQVHLRSFARVSHESGRRGKKGVCSERSR